MKFGVPNLSAFTSWLSTTLLRREMNIKAPTALAVTATATLVLLVVGLFVQHFRHGWPFSMHHEVSNATAAVLARGADARPVTSPDARSTIELNQDQTRAIGVRIENVRREAFSQPIRAVATIAADESRVSHVHTRVAGWIERLYVRTTGEQVRAGQPLAAIFSQELLSTQNEYLAARRAAASSPRSVLVGSARARLTVMGMTDAEIRSIESQGEARRLVTVAAPRSGIVLRRGISVGTAVDPSTEIVTVADLTRVWVLAEVPEAEIPMIQRGTVATLEFPASGLEPFDAQVQFLYPTLSERTRTLRVRFEADNPVGALRPGIYGTATFHVSPRTALTVPRDSIVDTGSSQHVFVVESERRFVPRRVKLGARLNDRIEVLDGLGEGDAVVASGVFLIDSESRLRASSGGFGHAHGRSAQGGSSSNSTPVPPHASQPSDGDPQPHAPASTENHQGH